MLWSGSLALDLRSDRLDAGERQQSQLVTATLGAMTYLYAPWLATVSGSLGLTKGSGRTVGLESGSESTSFMTGNLRLNLFPRSRFPAEFRYDVSDSRVDSTLGGGVDYRSRSLALVQQYRPPKGEFSLTGSYERRAQDSLEFGHDTQEAFLADFSSNWKRHHIAASLARHSNRREQTGEETDVLALVARHSVELGRSLSIESSANWHRSDDQLISGSNSTTMAQLSSIGMWRSETRPLTMTGSLRALSLQSTGGGHTTSMAAGVAASYEFVRNARLAGSLTATYFNGETSLTTVGQVSASYQGDSRKLAGFDWSWYGGASLGALVEGSKSDSSLSSQLGHTLSRAWTVNGSTWSLSAGQSGSMALSTKPAVQDEPLLSERTSKAMTQTVSAAWTRPGEQGTAFARVSFSDARQFDGEQAHFQLANFQLSGTHEIDRRRSWSADLSLQRTVQRSLQVEHSDLGTFLEPRRQQSQSASGEVYWRQTRLFNVPRLNFTSRLRLALDAQRQTNVLVPIPDRETASWENRLDYRVGRLESSISLRLSRIDGRQQMFAMWRLQRNFGG